MTTVLRGGRVFCEGRFLPLDVIVADGRVSRLAPPASCAPGGRVLDCQGKFVIPGLVDVHVHLREPGFFYKETIATGTAAGARGGYTHLCAMPNLDPPPDSLPSLWRELTAIGKGARTRVSPYGCITVGRAGATPADYRAMAPYVCGFSDDGSGVQDGEVMAAAMAGVAKTGRVLAAHCEVSALAAGGCVHEGDWARARGLKGIPSESEYREVNRDLRLAAKTGCPLHICHVSCKESVALIREARRAGVDVTAEVTPHNLLLTQAEMAEDGRFKMNPPLRTAADRDALLEGLLDGTLGMIATDHAPHSAQEKAGGLRDSLMGVVGLETALPVLYTALVRGGVLSLEALIQRMSLAPAQRFGLRAGIVQGEWADIAVFDPEAEYAVAPETFLSKGRATPFSGRRVRGRVDWTLCGGEITWRNS